MRDAFWLLVSLFVGRAVAAPDARSVATCADLGWSGGEEFGSSLVCAASDAPPLAGCAELASWAAARETCEAPGARL